MALSVRQSGARVKHWWSEHARDVWLALILAIAVELAIEIGREGWVGPSSYTVYLVGNLQEGQVREVFNAIDDKKARLELNGVPVYFQRRNDGGDPELAQQRAKDIVAERDALAVVGHVQTEETKSALQTYMDAKPRIPVIATLETDDHLEGGCKRCKKDEWIPLLQMAPTNIWQARSEVRYISEKRRTHCLIASDFSGGNLDYANNLQNDLHAALQEEPYRSIRTIDWDMRSGIALDRLLKQFKPDCAFYVGQRPKARELLTQLTLLKTAQSIMVVFPDAVVDPSLSADDLMDNYKSAAYTYPTDAAYRAAGRSEIGEDAFAIVRDLIESADMKNLTFRERLHHLLGMHRAGDARAQIIRGMEERAKKGQAYLGESGDSYKFSGAKRENAWFHVWTIRHNKVTDIDKWHPPSKITSSGR